MSKVQLGQVPGLVCIECGLNPQQLGTLVKAAQAASNLLYSQHENNRLGQENEVLDTVQAVDAAINPFMDALSEAGVWSDQQENQSCEATQ